LTTTQAPDRFTTLPDDQTLASAVVALEEHGFSVEVVDDPDAARRAVLSRIPHGSSVMTNTSVTLQETGIADAINDGGPYESARTKMLALDFATQLQEMKAIGGQPEYALGSVHAVTQDGTLVMAFGHKPDYQEHGNYLAFSVDHGHSWTEVVQISSTVTRAYCGVREVSAVELFVVYSTSDAKTAQDYSTAKFNTMGRSVRVTRLSNAI